MIDEKGFTFIEIMVAIGIFAIAMGTMFSSVLTQARTNNQAERKVGASVATQLVLDSLRAENPSTLPMSGSDDPRTVTIDDQDFEVTVTYCLEASLCKADSTRHITAEAAFNGETLYDLETVFTLFE